MIILISQRKFGLTWETEAHSGKGELINYFFLLIYVNLMTAELNNLENV